MIIFFKAHAWLSVYFLFEVFKIIFIHLCTFTIFAVEEVSEGAKPVVEVDNKAKVKPEVVPEKKPVTPSPTPPPQVSSLSRAIMRLEGVVCWVYK